MFREDLDRLKEETTAKESARQALSQGYKALLEKVDRLECALKEQGMLVSEKENELDINRMELARVNSKLQDIHHRLQAQVSTFPCFSSVCNCVKKAFEVRVLHRYCALRVFYSTLNEEFTGRFPYLTMIVRGP